MFVVLNIFFKILGGSGGVPPWTDRGIANGVFLTRCAKRLFFNGLGHVGHPWSERAIRIGFENLNISLEVSPKLNMHDMLDITADESPPDDIDKHLMWHVKKYL